MLYLQFVLVYAAGVASALALVEWCAHRHAPSCRHGMSPGTCGICAYDVLNRNLRR